MQNQVGGLGVILNQIDAEAREAASKIESKAKLESDKLIAAAQAEADKITEAAKSDAEKAYKSALEREKNAIEHERSQRLLAEKQRMLDSVISESVEAIKNLSSEEYFEFLSALVKKYVKNSPGRILMSDKDMDRMTDEFSALLKSDYPRLKAEASDMVRSGFIAAYDGIDIEENCTIDELVEAETDNIKEKVFECLFK